MNSSPSAAAPETRRENRLRERAEFIDAILKLCSENRGARVDLRSGAGKPLEDCARMHRYVAWRIPARLQARADTRFWREEEHAWYAVAALIASRPPGARDLDLDADTESAPAAEAESSAPPAAEAPRRQRPVGDLGASLAAMVNARGLAPASAEAILHRLTRQRFELVNQRLPQLIRSILQAGQRVNWQTLLDDLSRWDLDRRQIAATWMQSYYRRLNRSGDETTGHNGSPS